MTLQIIESAVEGMNKPSLPIYNLCLNRLGVAPHEAIFLDDMAPNLQTAKSAGIYSIKVSHLVPGHIRYAKEKSYTCLKINL